MTVMMVRLSEPLGPKQSVGEVEQQPCGHEGGERIIEDHGLLLRAGRRRRRSRSPARKSRARGPAKSGPAFWMLLPIRSRVSLKRRLAKHNLDLHQRHAKSLFLLPLDQRS